MRHTVRIGYQLYRHFSATGELLYVGISLGAILRLRQHRAMSSPWILDVARIEIQTYPSRAEAAAAEREAIKTEKPKYNKAHNKAKLCGVLAERAQQRGNDKDFRFWKHIQERALVGERVI